MPTKRFEKLPEEKRERILRSAIEEFGRQGLEATTLQDVALKAGVAKGLLYYYFEDRDDLLVTLFDTVHKLLVRILGGAPDFQDADSFWDFVEAIYAQGIRGFSAEAWMVPFIARVFDSVTRGTVPKGFESKQEMTDLAVRQVMMRAMALGALRRDLPPELLLYTVHGLQTSIDRWLFQRIESGAASEADAKTARQLYQDALGARKAG